MELKINRAMNLEGEMPHYEINYTPKGEKHPSFTTNHEADSVDAALVWAYKQLAVENDHGTFTVSEDLFCEE